MRFNFQSLSMMELRNAPGDILDRVAQKQEAFVVERNGRQMACLVPVSAFLPEIRLTRLMREFALLEKQFDTHTKTVTGKNEVELCFPGEGATRDINLRIRLPHGYPHSCPKVFADSLLEDCPYRWQDGSLRIFGEMDLWNPEKHDFRHALELARQWLVRYETWRQEGEWPSAQKL